MPETWVDECIDPWDAHWKRVFAWSAELALASGLKREPQAEPLIAVLDSPRGSEFLADLGLSISGPQPEVPKPAREMLVLAKALEHHFAFEPFSEPEAETDPFAQAALDCLQCVTRVDLDRAITSLPVFPVAAQKALQLLMTENWSVGDLEFIGASDPVLAADLIRVSNCCLLGPREPTTTLGQAIAYLGGERASAVLIAASVKRLFTTAKLREVWNHSLDASEIARGIAKLSGRVNPEEAFLSGLVHDIGRLAMALLPEKFQSRSSRLLQQGCELSIVERALCGSTHAQLGATALERWNFPRHLIDGVRFHHQPEACPSPIAAVLYLTERCSSPNEDIPSIARWKAATGRLGLDLGAPLRFERSGEWLNGLRLK
jgi:HD-like signal output (HDOD) protein